MMVTSSLIDSANGYMIVYGYSPDTHEERRKFMLENFHIDIDDPKIKPYCVNNANEEPRILKGKKSKPKKQR